MKSSQNLRKGQRGQSFVELALVLPILIIVMAGLLDLGRLILSYMELRDAAQEGVNYASIYPGAPGDFATNVSARVRGSAKFPIDLSDVSQVSISVSPAHALCTGSNVTVTVNYNFPLATPFVGIFFSNQIIPMNAKMSSTVLLPGC